MSSKRNKSRTSKEGARFPGMDGRMPIEGTENPRSFMEGTGKRKYDRDDPSVIVMKKRRATTYRKFGIGSILTAGRGKPETKQYKVINDLTDVPIGDARGSLTTKRPFTSLVMRKKKKKK